MKKLNYTIVFTICLMLAATTSHAFFKSSYSAALILGSDLEKVVKDSEHVLGNPIDVKDIDSGRIKIRRYHYDSTYDLALYFYDNRFVQMIIINIDDNDYPDISSEQVEKIRAFILKKNKRKETISIEFLMNKGQTLMNIPGLRDIKVY